MAKFTCKVVYLGSITATILRDTFLFDTLWYLLREYRKEDETT